VGHVVDNCLGRYEVVITVRVERKRGGFMPVKTYDVEKV
jgi:hypothetical protein